MLHFAQGDLMCRFDEKNGTQGAFFMVLKFRWRTLDSSSEDRVASRLIAVDPTESPARKRYTPV